jgi:hypothetical protein
MNIYLIFYYHLIQKKTKILCVRPALHSTDSWWRGPQLYVLHEQQKRNLLPALQLKLIRRFKERLQGRPTPAKNLIMQVLFAGERNQRQTQEALKKTHQGIGSW